MAKRGGLVFGRGALALAAAGMAFLAGGPASATVISYTDRASFEAALASPTTFDFNSQTLNLHVDVTGGTDFGAFTISDTGSGSDIYIRDSTSGSASSGIVDGTKFVRYNENSAGAVEMTVTFDSAVRGFGFDYNNADTNDDFTLTVDGFSASFPGVLASGTSGFFGLVSSEPSIAGLTFDFYDSPTAGSGVLGVDNFTWSARLNSTTSVPLPGTLPLFLSGLAGLGLLGWRRRRQARAA